MVDLKRKAMTQISGDSEMVKDGSTEIDGLTVCTGEHCRAKDHCARYTDNPEEHFASMEGHRLCSMFILKSKQKTSSDAMAENERF